LDTTSDSDDSSSDSDLDVRASKRKSYRPETAGREREKEIGGRQNMNATKDARDQKVLFQTPTDIGAQVATPRALSYLKRKNVHDLPQEGAIHAHLHGTPLQRISAAKSLTHLGELTSRNGLAKRRVNDQNRLEGVEAIIRRDGRRRSQRKRAANRNK
jgi:hypothetical protein